MTAPENGLDPAIAARLKRDAQGLVPAVVQQHDTGEVLMVGWMDDEALHRTLTTGRTTFWSRSREEYWVKGETSGHRQWVREVRLDCDGDTLLVAVDQEGSACHTGTRTCFDGDLLKSTAPAPPMAESRGRCSGPPSSWGWRAPASRRSVRPGPGPRRPPGRRGSGRSPRAARTSQQRRCRWRWWRWPPGVRCWCSAAAAAAWSPWSATLAAAGAAVATLRDAGRAGDVATRMLGGASDVTVDSTGWPAVTVAGCVLTAVAFGLGYVRGTALAGDERPLRRPGRRADGTPAGDAAEPSQAELWRALDEGRDPTE